MALLVACAEGSDEDTQGGEAGADATDDDSSGGGGTAGDDDTLPQAGATASAGSSGGDDVVMIAEFASDHEGFQPEVWAFDPASGGAEPLVSEIEWISDQGKPDMGAIMVTVPVEAYNQQGMIQLNFPEPIDLSGRELFINYKWESGFNNDPSFPGGVQFFVKTGEAWDWASAPWQNLGTIGLWTEVAFVVSPDTTESPAGITMDPTQVRAIGIAFNTGGGPQAGVTAELPTTGVFYVDSLGHRPAG